MYLSLVGKALAVKAEKKRHLILDPKTLQMAELDHVEISRDISTQDAAILFGGIQSEDCVHSWKNVKLKDSSSLVGELKAFENKKRPTEFFYYYAAKKNGERKILGVGTVAHKISGNFAHEGYPVIARCYITPEFRNYRLYMPILKHRFEFCIDYFGDRLRGIHLGSQNPRIHAVVKKNLFDLPFSYIGDEWLGQKDSVERVFDYLWFSPQLRNELLAIGTSNQDNLVLRSLRQCLTDLVENRFDSTSYHRLLDLISGVENTKEAKTIQDSKALKELLDFMQAIPLIDEESLTTHEPVPTSTRTSKAA